MKRIFYFDLMRLMAIVGIIFCHASITYVVTDMGTTNFYISSYFDCFRDFCVPIFVMLSGTLLIGKKDSLITFFKKRLSRILVPFIFWAAISVIYSFIYIKHSIDIDNAIAILSGHGGTMGVTFWFIWMIIVVYAGIFIINKFLEYGNSKIDGFNEKAIPIMALLSVGYIAMFHFRLLPQIFYDSLLLYYFSFLSYAIIGYFLANTDYLESKIKADKLAVTALAISTIIYLHYICNYVVHTSILNSHFTYLGYFNVQIMMISISVFLTVKFLSYTELFKKMENGRVGETIVLLSRYSYGIYLCHYLVLFKVKRTVLSFTDFTHQNSAIWIPLLVIITFSVSFAILWILNKIPYLKKVTGAS